MHVDSCDRLWLIDDWHSKSISSTPKLVIIDLNTDRIIKKYYLTQHVECKSSFRNIIVDINETDCDSVFAYVADSSTSALIVCSLKEDNSWKITHPYFSLDPLATDYKIGDLNYKKYSGILGMALSGRQGHHKQFLFQPHASDYIFAVRNEVLKDPSQADSNSYECKPLGFKGNNSQSLVLATEEQSGIIFYSLSNQHAIGCRNSDKTVTNLSEAVVSVVAKNDTTLINISDMKIDSNNLCLLSNKLPSIIRRGLNENEINFRIFSVPILDLVNNTIREKIPE